MGLLPARALVLARHVPCPREAALLIALPVALPLGIADLVGLFEQPTEGGDAQGISSTTLLNTKNRVNITCSFLLVGDFPTDRRLACSAT